MLKILTDVNGIVTDKEELKREWAEGYEDQCDESPEDRFTIQEYMEKDYYEDDEYIYDDVKGTLVKANDFFHKFVKEIFH